MSLWRWSELHRACGIDFLFDEEDDFDITGISIDTRTLQPGDLFIALSGDPGAGFSSPFANAGDGHNFIEQACHAGASAIMVHADVDTDLPQLKVEDTLSGLWDMARFSRQRTQAKVVAITGSSGKTTARSFIQQMLEDQELTHASVDSLNNHWGLPLSMARMPVETRWAIFEVGMNHPGEIAPLARLAQPDVALVLNVAPAHIGFFDSLEEIRKEKLSICEGLSDTGVLIVPDDLSLEGMQESKLDANVDERKRSVMTFGLSEQANVYSKRVQKQEKEWLIEADINGKTISYILGTGGNQRVLTSLASLAVVRVVGANISTAMKKLEKMPLPAGRGNQHLASGICVIDESYNSNPLSLLHAIKSLEDMPVKGRRIAILGDMLELGGQSDQLHADLAEQCLKIDQVISVGQGMSNLYRSLPHAQQWFSVNKVLEIDMSELVDNLSTGDVVLIKGSKKIFWLENFVKNLVAALHERTV